MRFAALCVLALAAVAGCTRSQEHYAVGPYPHLWYKQPQECASTEYQGDLQVIGEEGKPIGWMRHETITVAGDRFPRDQWFVMNARFETIGMVGNLGETYRFHGEGTDSSSEQVGQMAPDAAARVLLRYPGKVILISAAAALPPVEAPKAAKPKEGEQKPAEPKAADQK